MILPHIIEKMSSLDPEAAQFVPVLELQLQAAEADRNDNFEKKIRQVQIHRSLERMNVSALLDLTMGALPEHIVSAFTDLQKHMCPSLSHREQMLLPEGAVLKFWL
eukprot:Skav222664  [mRNA]  locus=scaffold997:498671:498988:+ [translate_table: standard]